MRKGPTTFQIQILVLIILIAVFALVPQIGAQSNPSAQEKISSDVHAALADLAEGEMTTVIVTLVDQADLSRIPGASHAARQQGVIRALQAHANASQRQISVLLNARQNLGEVEQYDSFWVFNGLSVTATQDVIYDLAARSDVWKITPDDITILPTIAQMATTPEANLSKVNAPSLWDLGFGGQGVVVANMDSGVDVNHPDLSSRWRGGSNSWYDPHGEHPLTPTDFSGHGTWTMGAMVGGDAGGSSIGVAPQAQWIAVKIFNDSGSSTSTAIHNGFEWLMDPDGDPATADAPHVVNNSWTMAYPSCDLEFELDIVSLRAVGILPIFAAGNGGPASGTSYSPANNPSAFAVGATDNNDQIYSSSSRGPSACDQTTFPDVVAPGVGILTADLFGFYTNASGTSLAAPHVSGGLALLLTAFPDLTASTQETALISGAADLGPGGPDNDYGNGRLDLLASYQWLDNPVPPPPTPTTTPDASVNLALNQPISVSSFQDAEHTGAAVVDGDMATSWQTEKASGKNKLSSEWVKVDLGSAHSVDKVVMQWDTNFATSYTIQLSANNTDWTTVFSTTSGNGVDDTITFTAATARYVMVDSTAWESGRLRNWLREFEVYSTAGGSTTPTATPMPPTATSAPPTATAAPPTATSEPGNITSVHIGDLAASANSGSRNRWDALVTIIVHDESEYPFTGATVEGTWSEGASGAGSCVTNNAGTCTVSKNNIKSNVSSVLFTVNKISGTDLHYSSIANHDPVGNTVTVTQP